MGNLESEQSVIDKKGDVSILHRLLYYTILYQDPFCAPAFLKCLYLKMDEITRLTRWKKSMTCNILMW